jgi:site-specific DNA-methyltransferase (adenine-specific)
MSVDLHHGDCLEVMPTLADGSVDLTVTSPPYDNLRTYNGSLNDWTPAKWKAIIVELYRITKYGGVVVWVVGDATIKGSETGTSFRQALHAIECGFLLHDTMIFKKKNPIPQIYRKRYTNEFEYMFILSKGPVTTNNPLFIDCTGAGLNTGYKNYSKGVQVRKTISRPIKDQKIRANIWEYGIGPSGGATKGHPAAFPLALARDHIISWSNPGDTVFDPFLGSGTTGVAAARTGRNFIGIERDENYFAIAQARIDATKPETDLR